ncbi:UNVERIFIED_ORG: hypothetical protein GGD58_000541 [Rhizobium pisi]
MTMVWSQQMRFFRFQGFAWLLGFCAIMHGESAANIRGISLFSRPDSFARMYLAMNPFDESFSRCHGAMGLSSAMQNVSCRRSRHLLNVFSELVGMGVIGEYDDKTLKLVLDELMRNKDQKK